MSVALSKGVTMGKEIHSANGVDAPEVQQVLHAFIVGRYLLARRLVVKPDGSTAPADRARANAAGRPEGLTQE